MIIPQSKPLMPHQLEVSFCFPSIPFPYSPLCPIFSRIIFLKFDLLLSYSESLDFCVFFWKRLRSSQWPWLSWWVSTLLLTSSLNFQPQRPPCPEAHLDTALNPHRWLPLEVIHTAQFLPTINWHWSFSLTLSLKKKSSFLYSACISKPLTQFLFPLGESHDLSVPTSISL